VARAAALCAAALIVSLALIACNTYVPPNTPPPNKDRWYSDPAGFSVNYDESRMDASTYGANPSTHALGGMELVDTSRAKTADSPNWFQIAVRTDPKMRPASRSVMEGVASDFRDNPPAHDPAWTITDVRAAEVDGRYGMQTDGTGTQDGLTVVRRSWIIPGRGVRYIIAIQWEVGAKDEEAYLTGIVDSLTLSKPAAQ
jgi:hypothetical protein